jgi:hypothetical protein
VAWYYELDSSKKPIIFILIGKESKYLTDYLGIKYKEKGEAERTSKIGAIKNFEQYPEKTSTTNTPEGKEAAYNYFSGHAKAMSAHYGIRVQFAQPEWNESLKKFTTTYRYLPADFKYGIPKGRRATIAGVNETAIQTAIREYKEETSDTDLNPDDLRFLHYIDGNGYNLYHCHMGPNKRQILMNAVAASFEQNYGELFDIQFLKYDSEELKPRKDPKDPHKYIIPTNDVTYNALRIIHSHKTELIKTPVVERAPVTAPVSVLATAAGGGFAGNGSVPASGGGGISAATATAGGGAALPSSGWKRERAANGSVTYSHPLTSVRFIEERDPATSNSETRVDEWTQRPSTSKRGRYVFGKGATSFLADPKRRRKVSRNQRRKQRRNTTRRNRRS